MHPNYFLFFTDLGEIKQIQSHQARLVLWQPADLRPILFTYSHPRFERPINCVGSASRVGELSKPYSDQNRREQNWERRAGLLRTALFLEWCQGQTAKVLLFTCLTWLRRVGVWRRCVCVWRGLSACVSGPPGTPLPEVGRAYVSYLRKSFSVTEINRLNDRMLCWKKQTKKKHLDTHTQVYLRLAQTKRFLNLFFKMWETTNMIKRNHRF